jgi:hypothetical protein
MESGSGSMGWVRCGLQGLRCDAGGGRENAVSNQKRHRMERGAENAVGGSAGQGGEIGPGTEGMDRSGGGVGKGKGRDGMEWNGMGRNRPTVPELGDDRDTRKTFEG